MPQEDQDVKPPTLDPSASQAETTAPPAESTPPQPPPATEAPKPDDKPDFKDALAAEIVDGKFDDPGEAPAADKKPDPKPAATDKPADPPPTVNPYDDPDDPSPDEIDPRLTKIRGGFEKLREKLRAAREEGQFGRMLAKTAEAAGIPADRMAWWVQLGARVNQGDPDAVAELLELSNRVRPAAAAPTATQPAPAPAPAAKAVEALAEQIYKESYSELVQGLEMTEDAARRLARKQAEKQTAHEPAAATPKPAPAPPARSQPNTDPLEAAAVSELNQLEAGFAKTVPDYPGVRAEALRRIAAEAQKSGPVPPIRWPARFTEVVRQVQAERAKPAKPAAPPTSGLRPSTGGKPAAFSHADHKSKIADAIMAGDPDLLP